MKGFVLLFTFLLQILAVVTLPIAIPAARHDATARLVTRVLGAPPSPLTALSNGINGAKGAGAGGSAKQKSAVMNAANSFARDVATVSASLNGMGNTTDRNEIRQLARKGYVAEKDEDQHRAVLNGASSGDARKANQKIVDNTPVVLDGLMSIMTNPSMANTLRSLQVMESARNKNILPSITQLSNSAFQQAGVNQQAKTFQPTNGAQTMRQLVEKEGDA